MHIQFFYFCLILLSFSRAELVYAQRLLTIQASIQGLPNQKVYLIQHTSNAEVLLDSTFSKEGVFSFSKTIREPNFLTITIEANPESIQFIWDSNVKIEGNSQSLGKVSISGSPLTDEWKAYNNTFIFPYRKDIYALSDSTSKAQNTGDTLSAARFASEQQKVMNIIDGHAKKYILTHSNSFVSLFLLNHQSTTLGLDQTNQLLQSFSKDLQNHSIAKAIRREKELVASVSVGHLAPEIKTLDLKEKPFLLSSLKGKYVLVDFWGTWCGPCLQLIPETKKAHEKYGTKGVQFVSIAYDEQKDLEKVKQTVLKHQMPWTQLFQQRSDNSPASLVNKFKITSYPSIVLIDPKGVIIFRGAGQQGLHEALVLVDKFLQ